MGKRRGLGFQLAALGLIVSSALAGTGLARWLRPSPTAAPVPAAPTNQANEGAALPQLFRGWPDKPDLVFLLSAQMHGYMLPCGCSRPQVGGLERRYNFLQALKERGWPVISLDLGDLTQKAGPVQLPNLQGMIKYRYTMQALKAMGYQAVTFGQYESALSLLEVLSAWAVQGEGLPRVLAANMVEPDFREWVPAWQPLAAEAGRSGKVTAGVSAVLGPLVIEEIKDKEVKFGLTVPALDRVLKEMSQKKVELPVLLYQGYATRSADPIPVTNPDGTKTTKRFPPEAVALAKAYPQFPLILCLSESDLPSVNPIVVTHEGGKKTMLVSLGHKGKNVGVVGVYRTGKAEQPFELRYQLVELTEDYLTKEGQEKDHPILELMEAYTRELKKDNYLGQYPQTKHPLQVDRSSELPTYVGSETCKNCHKSAYRIWKNTPHSHAYQTLVDARKPSLRQHDPECIVCHTVGFGIHSGFVSEDRTPKLKNVGCESCHGPAGEHVKHPNEKSWYTAMNPWQAKENETEEDKKKRRFRIDLFCQKCHDTDNDVTWTHGGFDKKWPIVEHMTPDVDE